MHVSERGMRRASPSVDVHLGLVNDTFPGVIAVFVWIIIGRQVQS